MRWIKKYVKTVNKTNGKAKKDELTNEVLVWSQNQAGTTNFTENDACLTIGYSRMK